jgi:DNA-binding CsgD family transcriptional regulator
MAWALRWRANLALWQERNYARARQFASESVSLSRGSNELGRVDQAFAVLAWCAYYFEDFNQAKQLHQECLSIGNEFGFAWLIMESSLGLGLTELALGDYEQAVPHCYDGLTRVMRIGYWTLHLIRMTVAEIASFLHQRGETIKALEYLALALYTPLWGLHPLSRRRGEQLLALLETEMLPHEFAAAVERGKSLDLESAGASLLIDLQAIQSEPPITLAKPEILTARELEILRLLADGLNSREVALQLYLSVSTIRWYLRQIYTKLDAHSRSKAIARARELKLLV